ncbi:MAG: histidinol dehydrogenase [Gammaproteobacteria bacterium]|nr:histidinol dehydrogenase [Gammaproteobacteria bacterium]
MRRLKSLNFADTDFFQKIDEHLSINQQNDDELDEAVAEIIAAVKSRGDEALLEYTNQFDRRNAGVADLEIPAQSIQSALNEIPAILRQELEQAAERIRRYHEHQRLESWTYEDSDGSLLGQKVTALDSVGVYVPGGKAAYPSSVLMNTLPAKVAGVEKIIMTVPTPDAEINPLVLAAAAIVGVDRVFSVGGAQAVAALAYGTQSIPAVDKIVGPGNRYVAAAKRRVFGTVGIDMIAGPSEILILADSAAKADWIAMDLFAQAEHDEDARAILVSTSTEVLDAVQQSINRLLPEMERREIIQASLDKNGCFIQVGNLQEAAEVINHLAPEHLELALANAEEFVNEVKHAGAIFMGNYTAEVFGDYCAGPNHVLPTARTARFSSPLGVYDFQKRSSIIMCSKDSAAVLADTASVLARGEGLTAHARSAEFRQKLED